MTGDNGKSARDQVRQSIEQRKLNAAKYLEDRADIFGEWTWLQIIGICIAAPIGAVLGIVVAVIIMVLTFAWGVVLGAICVALALIAGIVAILTAPFTSWNIKKAWDSHYEKRANGKGASDER